MDKKMDFYEKIRENMREWMKTKEGKENKFGEYLLLAPDLLHLLCKLSLDSDVPAKEKAKLATVIAYFISPVDLVPEAVLGPVGYADDIALAAYVLNSMINNVDPEIVKRNWAGDSDVLDVIQQILKVTDEMVGSGLFAKIKKLVITK